MKRMIIIKCIVLNVLLKMVWTYKHLYHIAFFVQPKYRLFHSNGLLAVAGIGKEKLIFCRLMKEPYLAQIQNMMDLLLF